MPTLRLGLIVGLALAGTQVTATLAFAAGQGIPRSEVSSVGSIPAAGGDAVAIYKQALRYDLGKEVPRDLARAEVLYRHAADMGSADAMLRLGHLYSEGRGVAQDQVEAYKWIALAEMRCSGRDQDQAKTARVGISKVMSPAMIEDAQKRARDWQAAFEKRK